MLMIIFTVLTLRESIKIQHYEIEKEGDQSAISFENYRKNQYERLIMHS